MMAWYNAFAGVHEANLFLELILIAVSVICWRRCWVWVWKTFGFGDQCLLQNHATLFVSGKRKQNKQVNISDSNQKVSLYRPMDFTYFWLSSVAYSYIHPSFVLQFLHITSRTMWRPVNITRSWMWVYVRLTTRLNSNARPKIQQ